MADRAANIAMNTCASVQVLTPSDRSVVTELAAFLDNDVNHWLETSTNEQADTVGPKMNAKDRAISRQHLAQRRATVRASILA